MAFMRASSPSSPFILSLLRPRSFCTSHMQTSVHHTFHRHVTHMMKTAKLSFEFVLMLCRGVPCMAFMSSPLQCFKHINVLSRL